MPTTKILWGQILIVFGIVIATTWAATQWTAAALGHQPQLGPPWLVVFGHHLYSPPAFFWWWFAYNAYAPQVFLRGAVIAVSGGFLAVAAAIGLSVWRAREARQVATYGAARWASPDEARAAGLLGPDGVVLGKLGRSYLRHDGSEHVLCFAPTRSGKGVGLVVPTLLTWPGSAIVHDIKGENWILTAGFRARFGRVLLFDPTNTASSAYNPLIEVRRDQSQFLVGGGPNGLPHNIDFIEEISAPTRKVRRTTPTQWPSKARLSVSAPPMDIGSALDG